MKQYKIYLFDFDYTLVDSSKGIVMCFQYVLNHYGYTGISDDDIKHTIGKPLEEAFSVLTGVTNMEILSAYRKEYKNKADICMTKNTILFPETLNVLTQLKSRNVKLGIISTKYRYRIIEFLDKVLPKDFFDIIVGGEDVKNHKPSPEGLLFAVDYLKGEIEDTLYVGDSTIDAEAAQAAGTDFIGVLHGTTSREELTAYPHIEIAQDLNVLL